MPLIDSLTNGNKTCNHAPKHIPIPAREKKKTQQNKKARTIQKRAACLENLAEDLRVNLAVRVSREVILQHAGHVRQEGLRDRPQLPRLLVLRRRNRKQGTRGGGGGNRDSPQGGGKHRDEQRAGPRSRPAGSLMTKHIRFWEQGAREPGASSPHTAVAVAAAASAAAAAAKHTCQPHELPQAVRLIIPRQPAFLVCGGHLNTIAVGSSADVAPTRNPPARYHYIFS